MMFDSSLIQQGVTAAAVGLFTWTVGHAVYNLYFSPLAKYPGPGFAAVSIWWRMYIEVIRGDSFARELIRQHERHGDIVRIGPNELHFSRPSAYHEIYNGKNKWDKDSSLYKPFADDVNTVSCVEYHAAKQRRDVILPLFSRKAIINLQYLVQECIDKLCDKIMEQSKAGKAINISKGIRCAILDSMFSFCFARELNALDAPDLKAEIEHSMHVSVPGIPFFRHFPICKTIIGLIPPGVMMTFMPAMKGYVDMRGQLDSQVDEVLANPDSLNSVSHPIIYNELLNPSKGHKIPSALSLKDEALLLVNAGVDTVSNTLLVAIVHILEDPTVHKKLVEELIVAWPSLEQKLKYEELESLPYLRAVIKEGLRLSHGVVTPMTRIVPPEGARISDQFVPAGTIVGASNIFVHYDDKIFPEPYKFKPERWLDSASDNLDNWLVTFSKGPRSCLGINLAYCDLYITLATLFRRFDMTLDGAKTADLYWEDCYMTYYRSDNSTIRASPRST